MTGVLVDTCIWSLALRSNAPKETVVAEQLSQLIDDNHVRIIGPIRQELLSGYSDKNSFERFAKKLNIFPTNRSLMLIMSLPPSIQTFVVRKAYKARIPTS